MAPPSEIADLVSWVLAPTGLKFTPLVLGWARAMPVTIMVPAFGLRSMPMVVRSAIAVALVACAWSSASGLGPGEFSSAPTASQLAQAVLEGVLIALPAALGIWIATMAGEIYDELGDPGSETRSFLLETEGRPTGVLFQLFAIIGFLTLGGPSRLSEVLGRPTAVSIDRISEVAGLIASGIGIAITLSGPLVIASVLVNLAQVVLVRTSPSSATRAVIFPLQGIGRLILLALLLEWVLRGIGAQI